MIHLTMRLPSTLIILLLTISVLAPVPARAVNSYLFGRSASDGFGRPGESNSLKYASESRNIFDVGYRPLIDSYGSLKPSALKILIKDDAYRSEITQTFLHTLAQEKASLMRIYRISNQDYNRLAAIAFGILGRETKFGTSPWYLIKEQNQNPISLRKLQARKTRDLQAAIRHRDSSKFFDLDRWSIPLNSRGLTQIKAVPTSLSRHYCITAEQLGEAEVAAVATMGFLAEALKITKTRARNRSLSYVTPENIFDYVLYVYFGSIRQLASPQIVHGVQINETATPERNIYIKTVKRHIRALSFFENEHQPPLDDRSNARAYARKNACRSSLTSTN